MDKEVRLAQKTCQPKSLEKDVCRNQGALASKLFWQRLLGAAFWCAPAAIAGAVALGGALTSSSDPAAATTYPTPYPIATTAATAATNSCGPYTVSSGSSTLYCDMFTYNSGYLLNCVAPTSMLMNLNKIAVAGVNAPIPGDTSFFWSNAGLGSQFLNVAWDYSHVYVTSLVPSLPFSLVVFC